LAACNIWSILRYLAETQAAIDCLMASLASAYGLANQSNTEIYPTQPFFLISLLFEINVEWLTLNQQHSHNPTMFSFTYTYLLTPLVCSNLCSFLVTLVPLSLRILIHPL
jgi:hypothetical protein